MRWLDGITDAMDMNVGKPNGDGEWQTWHAIVHGVTKELDRTGQLNNKEKHTIFVVSKFKKFLWAIPLGMSVRCGVGCKQTYDSVSFLTCREKHTRQSETKISSFIER